MTSQIATLQAALTTAAKDASDALAKTTAAETAAKAAGDAAAAASRIDKAKMQGRKSKLNQAEVDIEKVEENH